MKAEYVTKRTHISDVRLFHVVSPATEGASLPRIGGHKVLQMHVGSLYLAPPDPDGHTEILN